MTLARILDAVASAGRPLTPSELAVQTGLDVGAVRGMLDALRANGRLAPDGPSGGPPDGCAVGGSCGSACTGAETCPLIIDLGRGGLTLR
ncbi:MAG: helix-turn-helix domain-containing protein [Acidimicrobiia bacterium]|nr:helix-turn-helix domain-containing protein [Acidimicrobiia bacterium]